MTRDDFIAKYWKYYLTLERDFISTLEYVEFEPENFRTFSNRYVKITISQPLKSTKSWDKLGQFTKKRAFY